MSKKALEKLTCRICMNFYTIPIIQCKNKHPVCLACFHNMEQCPMCRVPYGDAPERCHQLEGKLVMSTFPCPNDSTKCTEKFGYYELIEHKKTCEFMQMRCPQQLTKCSQTIIRKDIDDHLRNEHDFTIVNDSNTKFNNEHSKDKTKVGVVLKCFDAQFFISCLYDCSIYKQKFVIIMYESVDCYNPEHYEVLISTKKCGEARKTFENKPACFQMKLDVPNTIFTVSINKKSDF